MILQLRILFFIGVSFMEIESLTCDEVLNVSADTKPVSLSELQLMQPKEIIRCLPHFGKLKLHSAEADYVWRSIKTYYGGVPNVPEKVLKELGWVTPAIKPEEYSNITFDNIDVIENFGKEYGLNNDQLEAIADGIRETSGKEPEDFTYYDLMALGQILCAFNKSEIERIHAKAYKEASGVIGNFTGCNSQAMVGFATLAVKKKAFGPPEHWDENLVKNIGAVAEYVPEDYIGKLRKKMTT